MKQIMRILLVLVMLMCVAHAHCKDDFLEVKNLTSYLLSCEYARRELPVFISVNQSAFIPLQKCEQLFRMQLYNTENGYSKSRLEYRFPQEKKFSDVAILLEDKFIVVKNI